MPPIRCLMMYFHSQWFNLRKLVPRELAFAENEGEKTQWPPKCLEAWNLSDRRTTASTALSHRAINSLL